MSYNLIKNLLFSGLKSCISYLFIAIIFCRTDVAQAQKHDRSIRQMQTLEHSFIKLPDTIQTSVYWYWLSDNISKDGVIKDLKAMKKVGINRAFIGNIGYEDVPYGKIKLFTSEWWEILHTALKTATKLGIEIGIFNSPGWSQSGGPWVKTKQSMRYLTSSKLIQHGPLFLNKKLNKPNDDFQDVKVIAYPAPKGCISDIMDSNLALASTPSIKNLDALIDNSQKTSVNLKKGQIYAIDFSTSVEYIAQSIELYVGHTPTLIEGDVQQKIGNSYKTIKHFRIDRTNEELNFGFQPYAAAAISIPKTNSKKFRLVFADYSSDYNISEIKISSKPVVDSYAEKTLAKMWQDPFPNWFAYQWPRPLPIEDKDDLIQAEKVIDISQYMSPEGILKWNVPEGDWIIERTGMAPTQVHNSPASPEGTGLETDKMSEKHIDAHFDAFIGEIIRRIPSKDRRTWKIVVADSYEAGSQNWTDNMIETFRARFGYDPTSFLPVVQGNVVGSADQSERFLWDLRRFIANEVAYQYVGGLREQCHRYGLKIWLEAYGHSGFPGEFLQYGGQSDEVSGEFWSKGTLGNIENRAASSCAHIYGKNKVSAESFTSGGSSFASYPAVLKQRADRFFTEGINNTLLHVYIHQPNDKKVPGINTWFGTEFNRHNTWFYDMDLFVKYLKRCNLMLQQGQYVADIAYFLGEDAPKMTGVQDPKLPLGYAFDYINAEVIFNKLNTQNGKLILPDGMSYKILVLPKLETMTPQLLSKIEYLVKNGAIVLGPKPTRSPSLQDYNNADTKIRRIADALWGKINGSSIKMNTYGAGMVIDGMNLEEALKLFNIIPDVKTAVTDSVLYIHRQMENGSIYFLSNQRNTQIQIIPEFRIHGKVPELWDPTTGNLRDLPDYTQTSQTTKVQLNLAPFESCFVVFKKDNGKYNINYSKNYPLLKHSINIIGDWTVNFDSKLGGPKKNILFKTLSDWRMNSNDSIKYYSGPAYYHNTFDMLKLKKNESVILDLGDVKAIAKIKVNGIDLGGVWTLPYKVDITRAVRSGKNILEIKIVNTWVNRLIGDSNLPQDKRKTYLTYNIYTPESKLRPSGLIGPVRLEIVNR